MAEWCSIETCSPEGAAALDVREAEDIEAGSPDALHHAGTLVAALAVKLLVLQAKHVTSIL